MIDKLDYTFSIKRIKKTTDTDYINAIKIYNDKIPYEIRTPSNEITMWLNNESKNNPFELFCFVLYFNNEVVGFAMETYIKRSKIMLGEYLSLKNEFEFETIIFAYIDLIRNYYKARNIDISFFVDEISYKDSGKNIDKESKLFKKMLCVQGYGEVEALHTTLPLGLNNFESSFTAKIYIKANDDINEISKDTYLQIIESIYYDYYVSWYKDFFTEIQFDKYKKKVDTFYNNICNELIKKNKLHVTYADCPILRERQHSFESITIPTKASNKILSWIIIILLVLILPPLITYFYTLILETTKIEMNSVNSVLGESISGILTFISAYVVYKKRL